MSDGQLVIIGQRTVQDIVNQRDQIKSLMASVMKPGEHYGVIPGCGNKPTLLQPGAQLMAQLSGLRAEYDITQKDYDTGHREYTSRCKMYHGDLKISEGVGICSTMETKYRYRNLAKEIEWTEEPVPKMYWGLDDKGKIEHLKSIGLEGCGTKKNDAGQWFFVRYYGGDGKVENPNIADVYNTVLKISKKRSYVDATITATASSDFFTQDLEDIADNLSGAAQVKPESPKPTQEPKPTTSGVTGWRDVVVHFGNSKSTVRGKKLGDLQDGQIKAVKQYVEGLAKPTATDSRLLAAIAMREAELKKANESQVSHRDRLFKLIDDGKIDEETFMKVLKKNSMSNAEFPADLSEEVAKDCVEKWDKLVELIKQEQDNIPM